MNEDERRKRSESTLENGCDALAKSFFRHPTTNEPIQTQDQIDFLYEGYKNDTNGDSDARIADYVRAHKSEKLKKYVRFFKDRSLTDKGVERLGEMRLRYLLIGEINEILPRIQKCPRGRH